jgi:hypothetical protein
VACATIRTARDDRKTLVSPAAGVVLHSDDERLPNRAEEKRGARKTNTNLMIAYAKAMTPEEIKETAEYFGAMT